MFRHQILTFLTLLAAALACNLPLQPTSWTQITGVTVTPPVGEKEFTLEIKYTFTWDRERPNAEIYCLYLTPGGRSIPIGTLVPAGLDRDRETFTKVERLNFTIQPQAGQIEAGQYRAGCSTEHAGSQQMTSFTVLASLTSTPRPEDTRTPTRPGAVELTSTPSLTLTAAPLSGRLVFDYARVESSRPGAGGELARVTELCLPEIHLTGSQLGGECEKLHFTGFLTDESVTVAVTGRLEAAGRLTFSYQVSEIGNPQGTWRILYTGQGQFASPVQAAGVATFRFACNSGAENLVWCWKWTSETFSGSLPWTLRLSD